MRLLVFLHGTTLMHPGAVGRTRAERVADVSTGSDPTLQDFGEYVPVGDAASKLRRWEEQGAEIGYLSSRRTSSELAADAEVLHRHGFPAGRILARKAGETYGDVVGRALPDVLVEDDCESIGGAAELAYRQIPARIRARVTSIVVPEFGGIDHLPDSLEELLAIRTAHSSSFT